MLTYLFDASAALELYAPRNQKTAKVVQYIKAQGRELYKCAILLIPSFCIVEVFNGLAKKYFRGKSLTKDEYEKRLNLFRSDIHWGKTLYAYELNRYHIIGADEIIPIEHNVAVEHERDHLSTFDILIIAMACELAFERRPENIFLVTCDRRMKKVVDQLKSADPRVWKVPGLLDDPGVRRWIPPNIIYLPQVSAKDVPRVPGQPPLNL